MAQHSTTKNSGDNPNFQGFKNIAGGSGFLSGGEELSNLAQLADFLVTQGASGQAAAGIASVVAGESTGNPEIRGSGGFGLIGWTGNEIGLPSGFQPSGNATHDMEVEAHGIVGYGTARGNWDKIISMGSATQAAAAWSADEAPAVPGSDERNSLIPQILQHMGSPYADAGSTASPSSGSGLLSFPSEITGAFDDLDKFVKGLIWFTHPQNVVRIIAGIAAFFILAAGVSALMSASK